MIGRHFIKAAAAAALTTYAAASFYPTAGVVVDVTPEAAIVRPYTGPTCNTVAISAADADYMPGDVVALIMHDNGTPEVMDDVPLMARYIGWIDDAGVMH